MRGGLVIIRRLGRCGIISDTHSKRDTGPSIRVACTLFLHVFIVHLSGSAGGHSSSRMRHVGLCYYTPIV